MRILQQVKLRQVSKPAGRKAPRAVHRRPIQPAPLPARKVGWGPGENMTFQVKIAGVIAGRAALAVGKPTLQRGQRVLKVRGLGETSPFLSAIHTVREELTTTIALAGLSPVQSQQALKDGKKTRQIADTFGTQVLQQINRQGRRSERRRMIPRPLFDPISGLLALRSLPLSPGQQLDLLVLSGTSLYRVELEVAPQERIYLQGQPHEAIPLHGVGTRITDQGHPIKSKKPRRVSIWLRADSSRLPLLLKGDTKLGPIEATLSSHQPAQHRLSVQPPRLDATR